LLRAKLTQPITYGNLTSALYTSITMSLWASTYRRWLAGQTQSTSFMELARITLMLNPFSPLSRFTAISTSQTFTRSKMPATGCTSRSQSSSWRNLTWSSAGRASDCISSALYSNYKFHIRCTTTCHRSSTATGRGWAIGASSGSSRKSSTKVIDVQTKGLSAQQAVRKDQR